MDVQAQTETRLFAMLRYPFITIILLIGVNAIAHSAPDNSDAKPVQQIDFIRDIQPIFVNHCVKCHGPKKQKGGLRFDVKADAFKTLDSGKPAVVRGKANESPLIALVKGTDPDEIMPPEGKGNPLSPAQIQALVRWIEQGADWPDSASAKIGRASCRERV